MRKVGFVCLFLLVALAVLGAGYAQWAQNLFVQTKASTAPGPVVGSPSASVSISGNSTVLTATLSSLGTADSVTTSFLYGTNPNNLNTTAGSSTMYGTGTFIANISGLTSGQTYYYKAQAQGLFTVSSDVGAFTYYGPLSMQATLPAGQVNISYSGNLAISGGTGPYNVIASGLTGTGLSIDSNGVISGTPLSAGTIQFTVTITDSTSPTNSLTSGTLSIVIKPAASVLDHIAITPNSPSVATSEGVTFTAQGYDSSNNPITGLSYNWSCTNATAGTINPTTGVFTAGTTPGTYSNVITVTSGSVTGHASITVATGTGAHIYIETSPYGSGIAVPSQNLIAGNSITVYAIERDASNKFVDNVAGTWSLTSKTGGVVNGDLVASGDTKSATFTGHVVGSAIIHLVYSSFTANSGTITVTASTANAAQSTLTPTTASITANGTSTQVLTVTAKDAYGNSLSTGGNTVAMTRQSGSGTIGSVTDNNNGTYTATVTAPTITGSGVFVATLNTNPVESGTVSQTQSTVTYIPGAASGANSIISASPTSITANGSSTSTITVTEKDAYGNALTSSGTLPVLSTSAGSLGAVTDNHNGTYTVTLTSPTAAGTANITGTISSVAIGTPASVTITAGPANKLQVLMPGETAAPGTGSGKTGSPTPQTIGTAFNVTVNAVDVNWNVVSNTDTVAITSSDASATLPSNAALVGGTKTFSVTFNKAGVWTVTATDTNTPALSLNLGTATLAVASGVVDYVPITLTNSQASPVTGGSQVSLAMNWNTYSSYLDNPVDNYEFYTSTGTLLYSWLESGTANTSSAVLWVKLDSNGIPASSSITIYMGFTPKGTSILSPTGHTGWAPQLSVGVPSAGNHYGDFDNGFYVFIQYGGGNSDGVVGHNWTNFTKIEGAWDTTNGYLEQTSASGGGGSGGPAALIEGTPYSNSGAYILESAFSYTTQSIARVGIAAVQTPVSGDPEGYRFVGQQTTNGAGFVSFVNDAVNWAANNTYNGAVSTPYMLQIINNAGTWSGTLFSGYGISGTSLATLASTAYTTANKSGATTTGYVGVSAGYFNGTTVIPNPASFQWFRMRTPLPNNTNPSAGFGSVNGAGLAGAATHLVYTTVPTTGTAGTAFSVTVQAQDAAGNPSNLGSTTTITLSRATGGGSLSGTLTGNIASGTNSVTISTPVYSKSDIMTLTATASGGVTLTAITSGNIVFGAGVATQLAYSVVPSTGTAGTAFSVTVQSQDANGNPSNLGSTTTITLSKASGGGSLSGTLTGNITSGTNSVTIATPVYSKSDTMTLTATASGGVTLTAVTSGNIVFSAGLATHLVYTTVPSTGTAGTAFSVTVQSQDANGNPSNLVSATTITLSKATGGGTLSGTLTGSIGIGANSVTISTPVYSKSDTMTLTATASGGVTLTAVTSGNIVFSAGAANAQQSTLTPTSATILPDGVSSQTLTVTAIDANGNYLSTGGATVAITFSSGTGSYTISSVTDHGNGTYTATVKATTTGYGVFVATLGGNPVESGTASQTQATVTYAAWYNASWSYRQQIIIDHTKVPNSDQSNFPVELNFSSNTGLASHALSSGNDILFTKSDGTTQIPYQRESYSSGALLAWVQVPTVSHTTDTVIYMYYGNSGASDQQQATSVWTGNNYSGVWHLDEAGNGTSGEYKDSTSGADNGTLTNLNPIEGMFSMTSSGNSFDYENLTGVTSYTLVAGDVLEYDVYWTSSTDEIAFDFTAGASSLRASGAVDQNIISAHPGTDLSVHALNQWYHRIIPIPAGLDGLAISKYDIACEYDGSGTKTGYLDNIMITNGATMKEIIYISGYSTAHSTDVSSNGSCTSLAAGTNPVASSSTGEISNALTTAGRYINMTGSSTNTGATPWTIEGWMNPAQLNDFGLAIYNGDDAAGYGFGIGSGSGPPGTGNVLQGLTGSVAWINSGYTFTTANTWYDVVMTNSGGAIKFYVNGVLQSGTSALNPNAPSNRFTIGTQIDNSHTNSLRFYNGSIDEARLSNTARSADWIKTEYNNQSSPSTFYTISTEIAR